MSSETVEVEGEAVFKTRRKDILKEKDIGNQAKKGQGCSSKASAAAGSSKDLEQTETIEGTLGEVFTAPLTHKTSLYTQFQYKARHAHKRLYTVLPKYSKIQVLPGITSCRLMKQ